MNQDERIDFKQRARDTFKVMPLKRMAEEFAALRAKKERLEAELADCNTEFDILRMESIPERMDEDGVKNVKFDGIGRITLEGDLLTGIVTERKGEFYEWLNDHGFGDLVQPNINPSTLKAFIKGQMQKGEGVPEEFVKVTPITRAKLTAKA